MPVSQVAAWIVELNPTETTLETTGEHTPSRPPEQGRSCGTYTLVPITLGGGSLCRTSVPRPSGLPAGGH